jgi:hypothetical protein
MMSFEAVFSFLLMLSMLSVISLTNNAQRIDTTLYEYQLLNDVLEVFGKHGEMEQFADYIEGIGNKDEVLRRMEEIEKATGYCLAFEAGNSSLSTCGDRTGPSISTTRIIVLRSGFETLKATMKKESI